jgi:predicted anti-sigma-YlaC factor YlaD
VNCGREADVWRAVEARHWPDRCDDELRAHVAACASCADLVEVASALAEERDAAMRAAHVPASGTVWWRAQLRARQDAARIARRAINVVQAATVAVAVIGATLIFTAGGGFDWLAGVAASVHWNLPLILAVATPLSLAPVALYFAVTED